MLKKKHQFTEDEISDFVDIFILRAVTYWGEVEYKKSIEAERIVVQVAEKLRDEVKGGSIDFFDAKISV